MTMHLFGAVLTAKGTAANNRGEVEGGTISTLQKIIRNGEVYSTVSSEAIRYALREVWLEEDKLNLHRKVPPHGLGYTGTTDFEDKKWKKYIDDDLLGFMYAKKETLSRRGVLEITRAISTTPWSGEISYNYASPKANPAVTHENPIPYAVEEHHTRYQYGFAMTPDAIEQDEVLRTEKALLGLSNLRRVGGNHARFLYDFSPEVIVLRWTPDPAPRMLLCFEEDERGGISLARLKRRVVGKDICAKELVIGSALDNVKELDGLKSLGVECHDGVKEAVDRMIECIKNSNESEKNSQ